MSLWGLKVYDVKIYSYTTYKSNKEDRSYMRNNSNTQRIAVFVDTSYLCYMKKEESADWEKLLRLSKENTIEIHMSYIAIEEYRTGRRDKLITTIGSVSTQIVALQKEWSANFISKDGLLGKSIDPSVLADYDQIENLSVSIINDWVQGNKIKIHKPTEIHMNESWHKYFNWLGVFSYWNKNERSERVNREARRKHIPDAWIYETANDSKAQAGRVVCLCKDGNLYRELDKTGIEAFKVAKPILDIITQPVPPHESPKLPVVQNTKTVPTDSIEVSLQAIDADSLLLQKLILGCINWIDTAPKEKLIQMLEDQGYSTELIENTIQRFVLNGLIADTGNYYIPKNKVLCEQAATDVIDKILELLEQ